MLITIAVAVPLLWWVAALAQDESPGFKISVSPPRADIILSPGDETVGTVALINLSEGTVEIEAAVRDFQVSDASGMVALMEPDAANRQGLGAYMTLLDVGSFTMAPNERRELSYRIKLPSGIGGGSRFGAIIFSTGPPPEPGRVRIVSQVASLVVVRVRGVTLGTLPTSITTVKLQLPVKAAPGVKITQLHDPETKLEVSTSADTTHITLPLKDRQGTERGRLFAESQTGLLGTGQAAVATVDKIRVESNDLLANIDRPDLGVQTTRVQLVFDLNSLPARGEVQVLVSTRPEPQMETAIATVASQAMVSVRDIAYVVQVQEQNVKSGRDLVNARITLSVPRNWAEANDPGLVRIVRYADDGSVQVLNTVFKGYDGNSAVFEASSPGGLSVLAVVAFDRPVGAVELPPGSLPSPNISLPEVDPNLFVLVLTPEIQLSPAAIATDQHGQQLETIAGGVVSLEAEFVPPSPEQVDIHLARSVPSGRLRWLKVPRVALAGHNTIRLQFTNTGDADYEVQPGLVRVVAIDGQLATTILVPNFNSFPGGSRDLAVDWVTPASALGWYTMAAEMSFGDPPQKAFSEPVGMLVLPWKWLLSLLLVAGGFLGLSWLIVRSVHDYVEKQVQRRIQGSQVSALPGSESGPSVTENTSEGGSSHAVLDKDEK